MAEVSKSAKGDAPHARPRLTRRPAGSRRRTLPVTVGIVHQPGADATTLFEQTLEKAHFWQHIEDARGRCRMRRDRFRIIIKPDLDFFTPGSPEGTDPRLVEHLIDLLHDRGFTNVAVGDGRNLIDSWLHNRDPLVVPELVGYRFATPKARPYDFADLQGDDVTVEAEGVHRDQAISRAWLTANYRIGFAKNKTHEELFYALSIHNLAGLVRAKAAQDVAPSIIATEACLAVLREAPPHFCIIDAFQSCHGGAGHRVPTVLATHTLIASSDAVLADWAAAAKMGLDPFASPLNEKALRQIGLPKRYEIDGDLTPYPLWRNVHPLIAHSARARGLSTDLHRLAEPWFQTVDRENFPFKDYYNDRINSFIAPVMAQIDRNERSFWIVVILNHLIGRIGSFVLSQHTMFSKGKLRRRVAPLEIDPASYDQSAYQDIPDYLKPYEQLLESFAANQSGQRWRHVDGSVLYSGSHVFPIAYDEFVQRVDIARAIQYMNDYIGGSTVPVHRDSRGRVTHQAERNIYLQQPNWIVLFGGEMIDVEKLEFMEYKPDRQTISWRTVSSPNASAIYDDGCVSFLRTGRGQTTVRIFARQKFALPLFFQIFDVNKIPGVRDPIIERAYAAFFTGTMANLQSVFDGRDFRIGRDAEATSPQQRELPRYLATAVAAIAELLRNRKDVANFGEWLFRADTPPPERPGQQIDRDGFHHFGPSPAGTDYLNPARGEQVAIAGLAALARDTPGIIDGLLEAVRNDLDRMANATADGAAP